MIARVFFSTIVLFAMVGAAFAEPKRVLLLHSFGPRSEYARTIREELTKSSVPVDLYEASLATARFPGDDDGPFVEYLRTLFAKRPLDLVVTVAAPAASFIQQYRPQLFPAAPMLLTAIEQRRVPPIAANDTAVAMSYDFALVFENMLRVLPETTNIAIVLGNSSLEKYWLEQVRSAAEPFTKRVTFTYYNDLPFDETLKRAAALSSTTAIFFVMMVVDAAGVPQEEAKALTRLHAVANAPIFGFDDSNFGRGIAGGPLIAVPDVGRKASDVAIRILRGEAPAGIKTPPIEAGTPRYDWRELQRWNISESRLPPGSEVYFRTPSAWEQYRLQIAAGLAVLLLQTAMISWLLVERRRRHFAEAEATGRRGEVFHLNRVATASVMSSSIAHELNQPLAAILNNTEAAKILLEAVPLDLKLLREILSDIVRDDQRASEIISGLRNLLSSKRAAVQPVDLNDTVQEVLKIAAPEAAKREIVLSAAQTSDLLPVRTDPIHMQQVLLNLVMNGMDAMEEGDGKPRRLTISTRRNSDSGTAEVGVSDTGKGIPEDQLNSIFDAFFTTKQHGTGLGLPIARTIVQAYGGTISAENRDRGAVFNFSIPLAEGHQTGHG